MNEENAKFELLVFNDNEIHFREYDKNGNFLKEKKYVGNDDEEKQKIILEIFSENYKKFFNFNKACNLLTFSTTEE